MVLPRCVRHPEGHRFTSVEYKGVSVNIPRLTPSVTHNGWIGPDHPETATVEWGQKMLQTTADYNRGLHGGVQEGGHRQGLRHRVLRQSYTEIGEKTWKKNIPAAVRRPVQRQGRARL